MSLRCNSMETKQPDLEALNEAECLDLLAATEVGRIAIVDEGRPVICPVNYVVDGKSIVVRTNWTMLISASLAVVAFEIDRFDPVQRSGWSVLVQGVGHDVTEALDVTSEHLQTLAVTPWAPGSNPRLLRVVLRTVAGWRFGGGSGAESR